MSDQPKKMDRPPEEKPQRGPRAASKVKKALNSPSKDSGLIQAALEIVQSLNIPEELIPSHRSLLQWERESYAWCEGLIIARKENDHDALITAARKIGEIIAMELVARNYGAPRIISEGLLNLMAGKEFKTKPGRKSSREALVLCVFYLLKRDGNPAPSQADVLGCLAANNQKFKPSQISKIFDHLGLAAMTGDARTASVRQRRKKQVSN